MPRSMRIVIHVAGVCNAYAVIVACTEGTWGLAIWHSVLVLWLAY